MEITSRKKIKVKVKKKKGMSDKQIKRFVMFYERVTKNMTKNYKKNDYVIIIDKSHKIKSIKF